VYFIKQSDKIFVFRKNNVMSSSTVSRYRETTTVTTPTKIYNQHNTSFVEEDALDAIAKEVRIYCWFFSSIFYVL
jgi:hypothetical protein